MHVVKSPKLESQNLQEQEIIKQLLTQGEYVNVKNNKGVSTFLKYEEMWEDTDTGEAHAIERYMLVSENNKALNPIKLPTQESMPGIKFLHVIIKK